MEKSHAIGGTGHTKAVFALGAGDERGRRPNPGQSQRGGGGGRGGGRDHPLAEISPLKNEGGVARPGVDRAGELADAAGVGEGAGRPIAVPVLVHGVEAGKRQRRHQAQPRHTAAHGAPSGASAD